MRLLHLLLVTLCITILGCGAAGSALDAAVDRAANRTGETVGDAVGQRVGEMAAAVVMARFPDTWSSRWMSVYVNYLFNVAFFSGSYAVSEDAYEPGEWTRWRMLDGEEDTNAVIERAFLSTTEEGNEWWRVKYVNTEEDEAIVLEGLFAPGRSELLRMRAQFPGEEPKELPVEEGLYTYAEPVHLTEESLQGATVGEEQVAVPAGTFQTRHVRYGTAGAILEWWIVDDVPGDLVRYLRSVDGGEEGSEMPQSWTVELIGYGDDAEPELTG